MWFQKQTMWDLTSEWIFLIEKSYSATSTCVLKCKKLNFAQNVGQNSDCDVEGSWKKLNLTATFQKSNVEKTLCSEMTADFK